ncbi:MAG TPA: SDR family oxidoreductase [Xanthobacteraceae bacterium]|jgi:NAD(P)-dependent dehydrogenase (short-subunit alcohol dehydrogenase family)|nr:SDR family oxidoreductase [Xanthobacteraceae bacterium]
MNSSNQTARQPIALVTGGARRIGRAIVLALADANYAVAIHAHHSATEAQTLCAEIKQRGGRAITVHADLADHLSLEAMIATASKELGALTLLVNNACEFEANEFGTLDHKLWNRHFAVNLSAPIFLAEAFARQAPAGADASIVNILDQRVLKLTPQFFSYSLTKSALHTATTMLAQALAPRIRVNAAAPGPTLESSRQDAADFANQSAAVPLGHGPKPQEIADAVLYLARARSVTGETIAVDGGQHIAWQTPDVLGIRE